MNSQEINSKNKEQINTVLGNFVQKFAVNTFFSNQPYTFLSPEVVKNRIDLKRFKQQFKNDFSRIYSVVSEKEHEYLREGLPYFELVHDYCSLASLGFNLARNSLKHMDSSELELYNLPVLKHSEKHITNKSLRGFLNDEANLFRHVEAYELRLLELAHEHIHIKDIQIVPKNKDILSGAYAAIVYGVNFHKDNVRFNELNDSMFGNPYMFATPELLKPNLDPRDILSIAQGLYSSIPQKSKIRRVSNGCGGLSG